MKFTTALGLATAAVPLVAARKVNNLYADSIVKVRDVETELDERGVTIINSFQGQSRGRVVNGVAEVIVIWANPGNGRATETINQQVTVTKTVTAGSAAQVTELPGNGGTTTIEAGMTATIPAKGATHTVKVGGPGGLTYQPDQLNNVPMGDTVIFEFLSQNHTVTQSPFDTPCKKLEGGMDSGFQANPNNTVSPPPQVAMQVMSTTPLWFYCRQKGHCGKGMVFSINPTAAKTQAMFRQMAVAQNGTGEASPITGGTGGTGGGAAGGSSGGGSGQQTTAAAPPAQATSSLSGSGSNSGSGSSSGSVSEGGSGATNGQGRIGVDGSCTCIVSCAAGGFPAAAQGVGAFGGMGGSLAVGMGAMR